ncbi:MAG: 3-deoxy-7-phosphoheptulonate synthase [Bacteroidetes bacterium]|jgi:3-deoxy-7-phosphoheptulonate synthase|nr:3-deoxy-7-phosphoheptulonate synthase [Bacteroidota bacterium]
MIIQLEKNVKTSEIAQIKKTVNQIGYQTNAVKTQSGNFLIAVGKAEFDIRRIGQLPGIIDIHRVSDAYKLVSKKWRVYDTEIDLGDGVKIGRKQLSIIAGPCSIEDESQIKSTIEHLKANQISMMRGGVFKPRTSPYAFRGAGIEGLKLFSSYCKANNIKVVTEVMQVAQIEEMIPYVDVFQVGTRNAQNFNLLDALGKIDKAVMLKRGFSGTIDELLQAAEYVYSNGNEKIILCERGIRTFETSYRNTLDLNAVPILKEKSHLPVIVDPSHGVGLRNYIEPMALAALMSGADGIIAEVHACPEKAASDGQQTLNYAEATQLYDRLRQTYHLKKSFNGW